MNDPIEKLFGKKPKKGYKITYVDVETYHGISPDSGGGIVINWSAQGIGFGQVTLFFTSEGIKIDNEGMSKAFCDLCVEKAAKFLETKKYLHKLPILRGNMLKSIYKQVKWEND